MDEWRIEPLDRSHQRGDFCCGQALLDDFLRSLVSQYEKRKLGRTYVAIRPGDQKVCGYYTLASSSISFQNLPPAAASKLPKHPAPVALLGRLAVDQTVRGRGLGEKLLLDALQRCLVLSSQLGIYAVEVMAIDSLAKAFYQKYGFVPLPDNDQHLFIPMKTIEKQFGTGNS